VTPPIVADTGGLLRALAATERGAPSFPDYEKALLSARAVIVPGLVLAEVDYFLRRDRPAMRKLVAEIFDPGTRYEYEAPIPVDIARAMELDAKFKNLDLGLVDGTVAAVAERRNVYRVLTTDRRDFTALRVGRSFNRPLELVPRG
jgi:predicted nucleic acid-binding protein